MIARCVKAVNRGVRVSRTCGFHVSAILGNASNYDVSGRFRHNPNLSTTSTAAQGTARDKAATFEPSATKGNCQDHSSGCLASVRRASIGGAHRLQSNVERSFSVSSRTQLARFSKVEHPPPILSYIQGGGGAATTAPLAGYSSWALRKLSTSSADGSSKAPEGLDGEGKKVDIASAGIAERAEGLPEEPRHSHVEMPSITDTEREAILTCWNVKVGDVIEAGDVVCEIELEQFSVGVKVDTFGFLAEILVEAGSAKVPVGTPIATIVHTKEDIALYQGAQETPAPASKAPEDGDANAEAEDGFTWKDVLRAVLRLRQEDKLSEDVASTLMSLARNKDADLLQAFEGCYEGDEYLGEIDDELFLLQANDIAKTRRKKEAHNEEGDVSQQ